MPGNPAPGAADLRADRAARLAASRLYLCIDVQAGVAETLDIIRAAIDGGTDIVQLRDKELHTRDELAVLERTRTICADRGALFAVNDRADLAGLTDADILHTGQQDLPIGAVRELLGGRVLLGRSTHTSAQAVEAAADPEIDYFCIGPVWETPTKPGRPGVGLPAVTAVAAREPSKPWFAIGGIDDHNLPAVLGAGARRIVVVRAIARAGDPRASAAALHRALEAVRRPE